MSRRTRPAATPRVTGADDGRPEPTESRRAVTDPEQSIFRRRGGADALDDERNETEPSNAVVATLRFVYRHSTALVPASILWVVCSLPIVTVGPATLGVYSLVLSLRETGRVDRERITETVRENLLPATFLGFLPVTFLGIASLYVVSGLATGLVGTAFAAGALYAGLSLGVLLIPTFVSVAGGVDPKVALRESYVWLARSPATGLQLLLVTGLVLVATLGLSVGFLLLFAGVAATYHAEIVVRAAIGSEEPLPSFAATRQ